MSQIAGRYAPSPTGDQHLGNLRSAVLAWVDAHLHGGGCALRIDDLDQPRVRAGSEAAIREELAWLGLRFDPLPPGERVAQEGGAPQHTACRQKHRSGRYLEVLEQLKARGAIYPSALTAKAFAQALRAPHGDEEQDPRLSAEQRAEQWAHYRADPDQDWSWRWAAEPTALTYQDEAYGVQSTGDIGLDDFIVWRRDGLPSYQLATAVDDHDLGVARVVRGADLIESTLRQVAMLRCLGWSEPTYRHLALVQTSAGERLAKRDQSLSVAALRQSGVTPAELLGWVASSITGAELKPIATPALLAEQLADVEWPTRPVRLVSDSIR